MSLKKVILSTVAAATLTTGVSATVLVEADRVGNLLKYPIYYGIENGNWATKIRVTNVNTDRSIVAKVVVREGTKSVEKLDFLIYLSPTDVFDGEISQVNGAMRLTTYDDSIDLDPSDASQRVHATADGEGIYIDFIPSIKLDSATLEGKDRGQQDARFGYIEVYGLMENAVGSPTAAAGAVGAAPAGVNANQTYYRTDAGTDKFVDLTTAGVNHAAFVEAAIGFGQAGADANHLLDYDTVTVVGGNANELYSHGWTAVTGGLTGEAVIVANDAQNPRAMAYAATALQDCQAVVDVAGGTGSLGLAAKTFVSPACVATADALVAGEAPVNALSTAELPLVQRGRDTNLLNFGGGVNLLTSIEDALAKNATYVTHYAADASLNVTQANNIGNMAETTIVANFITKKYSVEAYTYYSQANPTPTLGSSYGINDAAGNLFKVIDKKSQTSVVDDNFVIQRYVNYKTTPHDHFEFATTNPTSGVSGSNPGQIVADKACYEEVCTLNVQDASAFADGWVSYQFEGAINRDTGLGYTAVASGVVGTNGGLVHTMPYIPMVMTSVTSADGKNLVNIKYPAYNASATATVRVTTAVDAYGNPTADLARITPVQYIATNTPNSTRDYTASTGAVTLAGGEAGADTK